MTLTDISRLLKFAKVPRSKVIQAFHPNPCIIIHAPATHLHIIRDVVGRLALASDNISVSLLNSRDVRENEHVYVKVKGSNPWHGKDAEDDNYSRRYLREMKRKGNQNVVIDCASVVLAL